MKVALVCPYDLGVPGGVQDQAIRLRGWLASLGHQSILIGPGDSGPEGSVLLGGTRSIRANRASTPVSIDARVTRKLREGIGDADVVHVHEPLMPTVGIAATALTDYPTVGTFHADPPRWARIGYRSGSLVWKKAISRLDVVTTVSHVSASAIAPFVSARVIPNGVDVGAYGHEQKVKNRIAFLGRDDERKGLSILLDAWPVVVEAFPGAELVVIGAERDTAPDGVTFLGRVDESKKIAELARAEIYCAPNLGGESFGIVVAEGMASRCAVVASALPAFVGVLDGAGVLTKPGDPEGLAEAIISLLADRLTMEEKRDASVASVARFDGHAVAAQYLAAYEEAISSHPA